MSTTKSIALGILGFIAFFGILTGLGFVIWGSDFAVYQYFAPKYEQVRHDTFKQSQAYNDGMITDLQNLRREYVQEKDREVKSAIRSIILHRVSNYDRTRLPADLKTFIKELE